MGAGMSLAKRRLMLNEPHLVSAQSDGILTLDTDMRSPLKALRVGFEPVQDLHGYDKPWPGGGGANLWGDIVMANDIATVTGGTVDYQNKTVSIRLGSSEANLTDGIEFEEGTQYTFVLDGTISGWGNLMFVYSDGSNDRNLDRHMAVGANVSAPGKTVAGLYIRNYSGTTVIKYETSGLFKGVKTAAEFSPYSNICPISGWEGANVEARGKNLLDMLRPSYGKTSNNRYYEDLNANSRDINRVTLIAGLTYTLSFDLVCDKYPCNVSVGCGNGSFSQDIKTVQTDKNGRAVITFTPSEAQLKGRPYFAMRPVRYTSPTTFTWSVTNIQLEIGSTATAYEPYSGSTTPISWADEAGTVYGGTLEWLRDGTVRVVVDRAVVSLGSLGWVYSQDASYNLRSSSVLPNVVAPRSPLVPGTAICSNYPVMSYANVAQTDKSLCVIFATSVVAGRVGVHDSSYTSVADFKTAMANVQLCYELATPVTYTLTPQEALRTLRGENNLWSDANGGISATYWKH